MTNRCLRASARACGGAFAAMCIACSDSPPALEPGVSQELAAFRRERISDVRYDVSFRIPAATSERVSGTVTVRYRSTSARAPLVLDFDTEAGSVVSVKSAGDSVPFEISEGHIVIPRTAVSDSLHEATVEFISSDAALNRQSEFMYSLFVPDRASTAFPCIDQPDIKARYTLTLDVPRDWLAVANGAVAQRDTSASAVTYRFVETRPISTYLFAFSAGKFRVEEGVRNGRTLRMYHRESDSAKVARSRDAIFDLHARALLWLEAYTRIPFPFEKFEFVAVPAFQFGGMEHPGAILYRAASLLLDESPTTNQLLGRASLIAHETAHMWFGNLVTMEWFNDVWMKEVFANFMAAEIVGPSFPELNHNLRFMLAHHPTAYAVDRTAGANPIRQELENLREAGSLYGAIIYQKAPIMMRQLEQLVGATALRDGLGEYLKKFSYGNATWLDLIDILDATSPEDLRAWSHVWVDEPGRPIISAATQLNSDSTVKQILVKQSDPDTSRHAIWNQHLEVLAGWHQPHSSLPQVMKLGMRLSDTAVFNGSAAGRLHPDFLIPGTDGLSYARFRLDETTRRYLLRNINVLQDPVARAASWISLWEAMLHEEVPPHSVLDLALASLPVEKDELMLQHVLSILDATFWRYLGANERSAAAGGVEKVLWSEMSRAETPSRKRAYFDAISSMTLSSDGVRRLERVWSLKEKVPGLPMAEEHFIDLAKALAVRSVPATDSILQAQLARITNADRRDRFRFIMPALSPTREVRDSFFESLRSVANREREAWVLEGVAQLHHPLRADSSISYILPSLQLTEEIQRTGDIFFPLRWLNATLGGHQSIAAAGVVRSFLQTHPGFPARLKMKLLQASDELFRAERIVSGKR